MVYTTSAYRHWYPTTLTGPEEDPTMTLTELLTTLHTRGALPPRRLKDSHTALRYLARALGHARPEECAVEAVAPLAPAEWKARLDTYFAALPQPPSVHTVRNTRNNLSFLFRQA